MEHFTEYYLMFVMAGHVLFGETFGFALATLAWIYIPGAA